MSKRFTSNNGVFYTDNETGWEFKCYGEVVDLMNSLHDENKELKSINTELEEYTACLKEKVKVVLQKRYDFLGKCLEEQEPNRFWDGSMNEVEIIAHCLGVKLE